jgi:hypothetical protein
MSIESAASLANYLHRLFSNKTSKYNIPSKFEIAQCLTSFQSSRQPRARAATKRGNMVVKLFTQRTRTLRLVTRFLFPISGDGGQNAEAAEDIGAELVEFLPIPGRSLTGTMPFNPLQGVTRFENRKLRALIASPLLLLGILSAFKQSELSGPLQGMVFPIQLLMMMEGSRRANGLKPLQLYAPLQPSRSTLTNTELQ